MEKKKRCREGTTRHLTESKPVESVQSEWENVALERSSLNSKRCKEDEESEVFCTSSTGLPLAPALSCLPRHC
jgi:hypothetical protein